MKHFDKMQHVFNIHDIDFMHIIEGYTMACLQDGSYELLDLPLRKAESYLADQDFFRIHKSYLINLHRIKEIELEDSAVTIPINGKRLPVSRRKKKRFFQLIGLKT